MSQALVPTAKALGQLLVATDFSEPSHVAARFAHQLARQLGARLHLLFVERAGVRATVTPALKKMAEELGGDVPVVRAVVSGDPAAEIVRYADYHGIDAIVLGSHGGTGVTHVMLGSVVERVARTAHCPVVAVPADLYGPRAAHEPALAEHCLACGTRTDDLFCEACRARFRILGSPPAWIAPEGAVAGVLADDQIERVLRTEVVARLGCHAGGRTYVVPIAYAYDARRVYFRSGEGLKVRMMRDNPEVCIQIDRILDMANWESVVAWGTFHELEGDDAIDGLARIYERVTSLSASDRVRPHPALLGPEDRGEGHLAMIGGRTAVVGRIDVREWTGRFEQR